MAEGEDRTGMKASVRSGAEMLNAARRRTELELARRSADLTKGGSRTTMVAAIALAAAVPVADATLLLDGLSDTVNFGLVGAEGDSRLQQSPTGCKRRCPIT